MSLNVYLLRPDGSILKRTDGIVGRVLPDPCFELNRLYVELAAEKALREKAEAMLREAYRDTHIVDGFFAWLDDLARLPDGDQ